MSAPETGTRPLDRVSLRGLNPTQRDAKGRVRHIALTDAATELPNRLHFDVVYRLMWEAAGRGIPVTLLRFDLPGFGALSPDRQRLVGDLLNLNTRQMDMIARIDNEAFGVILVVCNAFGARIAADRFQTEVAGAIEGSELRFAAGIAAWKDWMVKPDDLLDAADEALRLARSGAGESIEVHQR